MNLRLLDRFFQLEYGPEIHDLLAASLNELDPGGECIREYEFNLFDLIFDAETSSVTIHDVLDSSEAGVEIVEMSEFASALENARNSKNEGSNSAKPISD